MTQIPRPILLLFLLLTTPFLSASVYTPITSNAHYNRIESDIYFYHGNHLGSASWITKQSGKPIQYIHYLPYGEILANQMVSPYDERFKFTGKEFDEESGYYYFGARYLLSELGNFISSDPLSDKYPEIQSYLYCNGNPVMNIDPDGRLFDAIWDALWVAVDVASITYDLVTGDTQQATLDAASLSADVGALFIPGVPAVAGVSRLVTRLATKTDDVAKITTATQHNYRKILQAVTGKSGKGYEAHHTLPQKHREKFEKLGINIDEPGNVVWRKSEGHRAKSSEHTKAWDDFFESRQNYSKEDVLKTRDEIEIHIWNNKGEIPIE